MPTLTTIFIGSVRSQCLICSRILLPKSNKKFDSFIKYIFHMTSELETKHVLDAYNIIAAEFDKTRYNIWPCVTEFLKSIPSNSLIAEIGCGNGKNLAYRNDLKFYACDISSEFVQLCSKRYPYVEVIQANAISLPWKDNTFNYLICIAVIHHLDSIEHRKKALEEISRILQKNGTCLVTVWAENQNDHRMCKWIKINNTSDYMIPWTSKNGTSILRYYHLFSEQEILDLVLSIHTLKILNISYSNNNWNFIIEKI